VVRAGFRADDENYLNRLKLSLCGCIGVMLTVLAAAVVFPVRARTRLRKSTAGILENLGNLAFQLLGEFCQVCLTMILKTWLLSEYLLAAALRHCRSDVQIYS
jgi:hypothetical protein